MSALHRLSFMNIDLLADSVEGFQNLIPVKWLSKKLLSSRTHRTQNRVRRAGRRRHHQTCIRKLKLDVFGDCERPFRVAVDIHHRDYWTATRLKRVNNLTVTI